MDTSLIIQNLIAKIQSQENIIDRLITRVKSLEAEMLIYKNKKNTNNSHTPPSKDENRPMKNQSLREKSDRKAGGQHGHEGKTLECSATIDAVVEHKPNYCNCCGQDLTQVPEALIETRQVIDVPIITCFFRFLCFFVARN